MIMKNLIRKKDNVHNQKSKNPHMNKDNKNQKINNKKINTEENDKHLKKKREEEINKIPENDPFRKAKISYLNKQLSKEKLTYEKEQINAKKQESHMQRQKDRKAKFRKTKKGQPIMKNKITHILSQLTKE